MGILHNVPCKCGRWIVRGVCEGCGKPRDECTCKRLMPEPIRV